MNLFLLFAFLTLHYPYSKGEEWTPPSGSGEPHQDLATKWEQNSSGRPRDVRSVGAQHPARREAVGHELRIEDIQTSTRMQNGIVIVPIANLNEDIISLERSVIRFLINHHYIVDDFIYQWERLKRRHLLNQDDQNKMMINEATIYKAIKKYQEDNALAQTGIMDINILKKVFGNKYNGMGPQRRKRSLLQGKKKSNDL